MGLRSRRVGCVGSCGACEHNCRRGCRSSPGSGREKRRVPASRHHRRAGCRSSRCQPRRRLQGRPRHPRIRDEELQRSSPAPIPLRGREPENRSTFAPGHRPASVRRVARRCHPRNAQVLARRKFVLGERHRFWRLLRRVTKPPVISCQRCAHAVSAAAGAPSDRRGRQRTLRRRRSHAGRSC